MYNPIKELTKREWLIWLSSLAIVLVSNLLTADLDILTLAAALIGVTSLIFAAKGNVWAQILMVVFSILYLGMTMPMAVWSAITWFKNPSEGNSSEVAIQKLTRRHVIWLTVSTVLVTVVFYYILMILDTPNIVFSTISIVTSFLAAALTMLRSSYYAVGYAANDVVLIVLWVLASFENPAYIPVVVNFVIFFVNDMYGFVSWKKREVRQAVDM